MKKSYYTRWKELKEKEKKLIPFLREGIKTTKDLMNFFGFKHPEQLRRFLRKLDPSIKEQIGMIKGKPTRYRLINQKKPDNEVVITILRVIRQLKEFYYTDDPYLDEELPKELVKENYNLLRTRKLLKEVGFKMGENYNSKEFKERYFASVKWIEENLEIDPSILLPAEGLPCVFKEEYEKAEELLSKGEDVKEIREKIDKIFERKIKGIKRIKEVDSSKIVLLSISLPNNSSNRTSIHR